MNYYPFLEQSPYLELLNFGLVIICTASLLAFVKYLKVPVGRPLARFLRLLDRRQIITAKLFITQLYLLNIIRIVVGLLWLTRMVLNLQTYLLLGNCQAIAACLVGVVLAAMVACGLFTPLACISLAISQNILIDTFSHSNCLPSQVLSLVLWTLALVPAGTLLSVDARMAESKTLPGKLVARLYAAWGRPNRLSLIAARTLGLFGYAALHFSSGLMHVLTPTWQQGLVNIWVLTDPVLSPGFYECGIWCLNNARWLFLLFAKFSTWMTAFVMLTFLPLFLMSTKTRKFAVFVELAFLVSSCFGIAVRLLGWVQLLLLALVLLDRLATFAKWWHHAAIECQKLNRGGKLAFVKLLWFSSFVVCLICFFLRQPSFSNIPGLKTVIVALNGITHMSCLGFGLREVNAFNFPINKPTFGVYGLIKPLTQSVPYMWLPPSKTSNVISDAAFYQSVIAFAGVNKKEGKPSIEQIFQVLLTPGIKSLLSSPSGLFTKQASMLFYRYSCPSITAIANEPFSLNTELTGRIELDLSKKIATVAGLIGNTEDLKKPEIMGRTQAGYRNISLSKSFSLKKFQYFPRDSNDFLDCALFGADRRLASDEYVVVKITLPERMSDSAYGVYAIENSQYQTLRCWNPPFWNNEMICCLAPDEIDGLTRLVMIGKAGASLPLPKEVQISKYRNQSDLNIH